jgi:hypothetical protein
MWPVSSKSVKKKLKEYRKKKKQDTSLEFLEYRSKSSSRSDNSDVKGRSPELVLDP